MAGAKTAFFNQFGQISDEGNLAVPTDVIPGAVGDGIAMLVDRWGRPYIAPGSGGGGGGSNFITGERPPTAANSLTQLPTVAMPLGGSAAMNVGAAKVYRVWVSSLTNDRVWLQLHDVVGPPAGAPLISVPVPVLSARESAFLDLSPIGMFFAVGVVIAISRAPGVFVGPAPVPSAYWWSAALTS